MLEQGEKPIVRLVRYNHCYTMEPVDEATVLGPDKTIYYIHATAEGELSDFPYLTRAVLLKGIEDSGLTLDDLLPFDTAAPLSGAYKVLYQGGDLFFKPVNLNQPQEITMNEGATKEMPQYHCHKKVWALKITEIVGSPDTTGQGAYLHTEKDFAPIEVNAEWMTRHKPEIGGYYVVYKDGYKSYSPAEAFEDGYTLDMAEVAEWPVEADINAKLARLAHTVNKAYCEAIGDDSQVDWFNAPQWQRDSAIAGVEFVRNNPEAGPDASHNSWLRQKEADGWVYGCVKDPDKKQHPCMVSFEALPAEQQAKDHLFRAVVLGAAAM